MNITRQNILKAIKTSNYVCCLFLYLFVFSDLSLAQDIQYSGTDEKAVVELDIDNTVDYKIDNKDNEIIISFSKPIAQSLEGIATRFPDYISAQKISKDKKSIALSTINPLITKSFWKDKKLYIEISSQNKTLLKNSLDNKKKIVTVRYGEHDKFSRLVFDFEYKPLYSINQEDKRTILSFITDINLDTSGIGNYSGAGLITQTENKLGGTDVSIPTTINQSYDYPNKIVLDIPLNVDRNPQKNVPIDVLPNHKLSRSYDISAEQKNLASIDKDKDKIASLSFSWNIPVGLAVFKREDYLWIAFDRRQKIDIEELAKSASDLVDEMIQLPHPMATVIRLKPKENVYAAIRNEGLLWVVDLFTRDISNNTKNMPIFIEYNSSKEPYLFIPTTTSGNIVSFIDPEIGDMITTAPTTEVALGLTNSYIYPDFDLINSLQGLALVSKTNDIIVNRGNTGLSIKAMNRGLNISSDLEKLKRHQMMGSSDSNIFNLELSAQLLKQDFNKSVFQLSEEIANAPADKKIKAQMELAKYYIGKGLGIEALVILDEIKSKNVPEAKSEQLYALHGVANFLARRNDAALEDFAYGKLPNNNEAIFWRTITSSAKNFKKEDNIVMLSFISLIKDYPQSLKERIALIGAETAINANDDISAQNFIDILKSSENMSENRRANLGYLMAKNLVLQGYPRNAVREYSGVARSGSQKYSALSRKEMVLLQYNLKAIPVTKAISEYERLRYTWGKKVFQQELLDRLGDFYVANKDYYNALKTMQSSLSLADDKQKERIINKMIKTFEDVYINDQIDNGPALKSLALYEDFEWLAPKSKRYNDIIRRLADRLVAVDLLGRASKLLFNQLQHNNLGSVERSKVGTRLALVHLFENEEEMTLKVLEDTENPNASETIKAHRQIIKAKALSNLGREDEALELLKDDMSKNGILLKSEIYWNAGQWGPASDTIKYLIETPVKGKPLSNEQIGYILDWATALKKSGKETVIVRLRNKFMPHFENTKYYSAFSILTNSLESDKIDIKAINQAIDEISSFSNFTKIYNNSLKNSGLSKIIE